MGANFRCNSAKKIRFVKFE